MKRAEYKNILKKKKATLLFYTLVGFVSLILSTWIITFTTYKSQETEIIQNQLDSLIYLTSQLHQGDTTFNVTSHLPKNKISINDNSKIIQTHFLIFGFIIVITILYFQGYRIIDKSDILRRKSKQNESE